MSLAPSVVQYLRKSGIDYDVIQVTAFDSAATAVAAARIPPAALARGFVVTDQKGPVMTVVPATDDLDLEGINALLGRKVEQATAWQVSKIFTDCDHRFLPALGDAYGLRTLIDERLIAQGRGEIYLFGGDAIHLLRFTRQAFMNLQGTAWFAQGLGIPQHPYQEQTSCASAPAAAGVGGITVRQRLEQLDGLPMMPGIAYEVFKLRADPGANAQNLAKVVEVDPSLTAQIIRYANAPFFGYRGKVDSVQTAISRVLGFETVMNLALGIATAKPFKIPRHGPLGLVSFWRHAIYSAAVMQVLSRDIAASLGLKPGVSYLAGLLHNFGVLLLGHLFADEYRALSAMVDAAPDKPLAELEHQVIGMDHGSLGAKLLEVWGLPQEVVVTAREHHHSEYQGPHAQYVGLTLVTDRLLRNHGIGDAPDGTLPPHILAALGLDELKVLGLMSRILEGCAGLDAIARQLAA